MVDMAVSDIIMSLISILLCSVILFPVVFMRVYIYWMALSKMIRILQPNKVHGDSWAQSEVLFGVAPLLAVEVMPRIKHFKHLYYYKASRQDHYENIDELFTEKALDWDLIETHYHDMLRVVISIQKGKVKASTVLRKLCSKSRKNKLYFAFRELGRAERTIFLLNYINDPELRRMIQAATCKSEEFNQFISWLRFGGGGVIGDNMRANQSKDYPVQSSFG